jgi:restriction endonuclease S subunit
MTRVPSIAITDLLKREPAKLVAGTGLIFESLGTRYGHRTVADVLDSHRGGVWGEDAAEGCGYPVLRSTNMRGSKIDVTDVAWRAIPAENAAKCELQTGDILVTKSSGSSDLVGESVLFVHPGGKQVYLFSNFTHQLRADSNTIVPAYLAWFLRSPQSLGWRYDTQQNAVGLRNLQIKEFLSQQLATPPLPIQEAVVTYLDGLESGRDCSDALPPQLAEQRRIVARIETLASQIAEARSLRHHAAEEAPALLTTARRAVILDCKASIVPLADACAAIIDNLHSNPQLAESGIPCVRSPDVGFGTLDLDGAQRTDEAEFIRRTIRGEPQADDIVLVREGGGTGKCAVVLPGQRFSLGQRVMMLRPDTTKILPRFFLHQLLSPLMQEDQIAPLSKGSASPHLNIGALRQFTLHLPPLPEQRRIVAHLDRLQTQADALKRLQSETAAELAALLPAILDRAFKGGL